jgi:DNA-binding NtrC family response regulator
MEPTVEAAASLGRVHGYADELAASDISILISGETGVGKERLAETLHKRSPRAGRPFLRIPCAALSETSLESELFGRARSALLAAPHHGPSLLEAARGGTVFLDEVDRMSLALQARLLHVIDGRGPQLTDGVSRASDVRFIAATTRSLEAEVGAGRFRADLFFQLSGIAILIPPLRERRYEVEALARQLVGEIGRRMQRRALPALSAEAGIRLRQHVWPGNVRELRNVLERALVLCHGPQILPEHLELRVAPAIPMLPVAPAAGPGRLHDDVQALEQQRIVEALARYGGNQTRAAKLLGISRGTLRARLDCFRLPRPRKAELSAKKG